MSAGGRGPRAPSPRRSGSSSTSGAPRVEHEGQPAVGDLAGLLDRRAGRSRRGRSGSGPAPAWPAASAAARGRAAPRATRGLRAGRGSPRQRAPHDLHVLARARARGARTARRTSPRTTCGPESPSPSRKRPPRERRRAWRRPSRSPSAGGRGSASAPSRARRARCARPAGRAPRPRPGPTPRRSRPSRARARRPSTASSSLLLGARTTASRRGRSPMRIGPATLDHGAAGSRPLRRTVTSVQRLHALPVGCCRPVVE